MKAYLDPFLDMKQVLLAVLQVLSNFLGIAAQEAGLWCLSRLNWHAPGPVLDARGEVVWTSVGMGRSQVHVQSTRRAVIGVEWMLLHISTRMDDIWGVIDTHHASYFTSIRLHAAGGLT